VERVADAGATFVVSPNRDAAVIQATKIRGMASFPGCLTPSEMVEALAAGADAVKLFPARMIEPATIADIRGPFDDLRIIPTGGVDAARARQYIAAGAWAVGVGSTLVSSDVLRPGGMDRLAARAAELVSAVRDTDHAAD
jgi:Entner-Doudoroff aldolase